MAEMYFEEKDAPEMIPAGYYMMTVADAEPYTSKNGENGFLFRFSILEGNEEGRSIFQYYFPTHSNPKASEIARIALTQLMHACELNQRPTDTDEFLDIPIFGKVTIRTDKSDGRESNSVGNFISVAEHKAQGAGTVRRNISRAGSATDRPAPAPRTAPATSAAPVAHAAPAPATPRQTASRGEYTASAAPYRRTPVRNVAPVQSLEAQQETDDGGIPF